MAHAQRARLLRASGSMAMRLGDFFEFNGAMGLERRMQEVTLADGSKARYLSKVSPRLIREGDVGFCEAYMEGGWSTPDLQAVMERYNTLMQKVQREGMARFEAKLRAHSEPGKQLASARALFDLWIDASEEAFAQIALGPEYRHVYGELVNAQMRLRQCGMAIVEEQLKALGLPSRTELDSNHNRTHELSRQVRPLTQRIAELELAAGASSETRRRPESAPRPTEAGLRAETSSAETQPNPQSERASAKVKPRAQASKASKPAAKAAAKQAVKASASRKKTLPPLAAVTPKAPVRARKGR